MPHFKVIDATEAPPNPVVHTGDPESSVLAAEHMRATGKRLSHGAIIAAYVTRHPGLTAGEYARMTGMEVHEVRRRLTDLKASGKAYQGCVRVCRMEGTAQCEWWPA